MLENNFADIDCKDSEKQYVRKSSFERTLTLSHENIQINCQ